MVIKKFNANFNTYGNKKYYKLSKMLGTKIATNK